jgi:uncharacterized small protein (DUF1192 family)
MKKIVLVAIALAAAIPVAAQQPTSDPRAEAYKAMYLRASDDVAAYAVLVAGLQEQVKALTAERDKLKAELEKPAK